MKSSKSDRVRAAKLLSATAILLLALGVIWSNQLPFGRLFAMTAPAATPYTVMLRESVTDATGRETRNAIWTFAARSDASRVYATRRNVSTGRVDSRRYIELATGDRIQIGDLWEIRSSVHMSKHALPLQWHRDPKSNCLKNLAGIPVAKDEQVVDQSTIAGLRAVRVRWRASETWYALDHGCAVVQERHDFGNSKSEKTLIALIPGDPDPALFLAPRSYRELPPSEFAANVAQRLGTRCCGPADELAKEDSFYRARRPLDPELR